MTIVIPTFVLFAACTGTMSDPIDPSSDGAVAGRDAGPRSDGAPDPERDAGPRIEYPPGEPGCGFEQAAFCETFDDVAADGSEGRVAELDARRWSGARMQPGLNWDTQATHVRAATLPSCRADLPAQVYPGQDALVCDGNDRVRSRHLLMTAAEQSYGQFSLRTRRPFDFRDRTGIVRFDAEGEITGVLQGWPSVSITEDPSPAPSFGILQNFENGAIPRAGVEVHFFQICGSEDRVGVAQVNVFRDYEEQFFVDDRGGRTPTCVLTERGALNRFELRISRTRLEVWGTDRSEDGIVFGELQPLFAVDVALPFDRGYVHFTTHNHSSLKYSDDTVDAWTTRWDNLAFDGPVIDEAREYSIADSLMPVSFDGVDYRNVGYQLGDVSEGPRQMLTFRGVDPTGATAARLALNGHFNTHTDVPFEDYALRYRVNGRTWREHRFTPAQLALLRGPNVLDEMGVNTRGDGAGIAGAISLLLDLDPSELVAGDNTLEFVTAGVPNGYRPYVANVDLVLDLR